MDKSLFSLAGKSILVTGAAGHLGSEICEYLLAAESTVLAVDVNEAKLIELTSSAMNYPGELTTFVSDLSEENERIALADQVSSLTPSLDGAVFAAAFVGTSELAGWAVGFDDQSLSAWRAALELNLTAPFHLTQLLTPLLREGSGPSIVTVGSIYGSIGPDWSLYEGLEMSNPAGYAASKGGLRQLTRWLASTLAPDIRVNSVAPGGIFRNQPDVFVQRYANKTPLKRMASEQDIVGAVAFLLSGASGYVTGQEIVVDGGRLTS